MNSQKSGRSILKSSWRIGSYRGVQIKLHVSLLIALPYLVFVTYAGFDALSRNAGVSRGELSFGPLFWSVAMAVLLFSSVLIHEFGHVLVALRQGAKVRSITLMMLGGISDIDDIPEKPSQEFRLALMGPIVSLALSGLGYGIFNLSLSPNLNFISIWFGQINLVLAIFNLLPAFPLDGGRVLRALMASRVGQIRATKTAAKISTAFAWIFALAGIIGFNILLVLIAFFIYAAAQSELSVTFARKLLKGLRVGDAATLAEALNENDTLDIATERMLHERTTLLPVRTGTGYSLISLQQIRSVPQRQRSQTTVGEVTDGPATPLDSEASMDEALTEIATAPLGALPVLREGNLIGYIRYIDLSDVLQLRSLESTPAQETPNKAA
ncbi:site-2 protease family protein [bacterium]|nr:site-2 protease family protein [bacterium]